MHVTSAKRNRRFRQTIVLRHYTTVWRRNKHRKIDFLVESLVWPKRNRIPRIAVQRRWRLLKGGTETATVRARSGGCLPRWRASVNISMAWPVLGGTKIVASSRPSLTQAWPVLGKPSQPRNGRLSQRSFSVSSG